MSTFTIADGRVRGGHGSLGTHVLALMVGRIVVLGLLAPILINDFVSGHAAASPRVGDAR